MKKILPSLFCLFIFTVVLADEESPILYQCKAYIKKSMTIHDGSGNKETFVVPITKDSGQAGRNIRSEIFQAFNNFNFNVGEQCNIKHMIPEDPESSYEWKWDTEICGYTCDIILGY